MSAATLAGNSGDAIRFLVHGHPVTQGGMRSVPTGAGMRQITTGGVGLAGWRQEVAACAARAAAEAHHSFAGKDPVEVAIEFRFPMLKSTLKRDRAVGVGLRVGRPTTSKSSSAPSSTGSHLPGSSATTERSSTSTPPNGPTPPAGSAPTSPSAPRCCSPASTHWSSSDDQASPRSPRSACSSPACSSRSSTTGSAKSKTATGHATGTAG